MALSYLGFKIVSKEYQMKIESGYPFDEQDVKKMDLRTFLIITGAGKYY
jgi:hypothetical protein